jgi:hypothetical protein
MQQPRGPGMEVVMYHQWYELSQSLVLVHKGKSLAIRQPIENWSSSSFGRKWQHILVLEVPMAV